MAISAFSNLAITISDGGTVPSLDYLSTKTYVNIGSGNVLKVSWNTPTATDDPVVAIHNGEGLMVPVSGQLQAMTQADLDHFVKYRFFIALRPTQAL